MRKDERGILCARLLRQLRSVVLQSCQKEGTVLLLSLNVVVLDPRFHLVEDGLFGNRLHSLRPLLLSVRVRLDGVVPPLVRLFDQLSDETAL